MNPRRFLTGLGITMAVQIAVNLVLIASLPPVSIHATFIYSTIIVMAFFCLSLYLAARVVVRSTMTRLYIQLIMIAVFIKLFLCVAIVLIYKQGFEPANYTFIWPFLFIYITSTIYEVIFLDKVGRQKNNSPV